jgi:hypothetical protein
VQWGCLAWSVEQQGENERETKKKKKMWNKESVGVYLKKAVAKIKICTFSLTILANIAGDALIKSLPAIDSN